MNRKFLVGICLLSFLPTSFLWAQQVEVEEYVLPNGMTFLLVPRKGDPNVAAGWVAKVGSANEYPGITGLSHLFEHMMFKGTHTIGTSDIEENLSVMAKMDEVKAEIDREDRELIRKKRLGLIGDHKDPENRSERHQKLLTQFDELAQKESDLIIKNELGQIYTTAGASGLNAGTNNDSTFYFINVPANKLELWFWMESDRLANPVFREFYAERAVVYEERRMRTDSTPTGKFREEFESLFWTSHPYSWPVVGWPSDLDAITRQEAQNYFDLYYAPNNLVACLVGEFDIDEAKKLIDRYFGRLKRSEREAVAVRTHEVKQEAEKRMVAFAETNPTINIRYHTVADGHVDEPALVVTGALLSGRTGRLQKSLVLDQKIANQASAGQNGLKWAGSFSLRGVAKEGVDLLDLEAALNLEVEKLKTEPASAREIEKVKNREAANAFRRIENNFFLMFQLMSAGSNRGWKSFNEDPKRIQEVTAEDIMRVANKYFVQENRAVALYYTKQSDEPEDPMLADLTPEQKARVKQFKGMVGSFDKAKANQFLGMMASPPEPMKAVAPIIMKLLEERLKELEGGKK